MQPWTDAAQPPGVPPGPPLRTTVLVAHPADEILSLGGQLAQIGALTLVHVTDGAPRELASTQRASFASRDSYAQARSRELDRALAAAGVRHARSRELGITEQEVTHHLSDLVKVLIGELAHADVVLTHPYEGGHPDHDACAFAVQAACTLRWLMGAPTPQRLEFACYHARDGRLAAGRFWEAPGCPERVIALDHAQLTAKRAALAELLTQSSSLGTSLGKTPAEVERLRRAPSYDFARPPPPEEVLYERQDGAMSGVLWRSQALGALRALGLD